MCCYTLSYIQPLKKTTRCTINCFEKSVKESGLKRCGSSSNRAPPIAKAKFLTQHYVIFSGVLRSIIDYFFFALTIDLIRTLSNIYGQDPRSVAVNHAGLWIRRHQFESGRGYPDKKLESFSNSFKMRSQCSGICLPQQ